MASIAPSVVLVALLGGFVFAILWFVRPPITEALIIAFVPWMAVAAVLSVLARAGVVPPEFLPLVRSPVLYVTTATVAGGVLLIASLSSFAVSGGSALAGKTLSEVVGVAGTLALAPLVGAGTGLGDVRLFWPLLSVATTVLVAGVVWWSVRVYDQRAAVQTGAVGALVLFGHVLDGITTLVGVDIFGYSEQTPLSRAILELATGFPISDAIGAGWLFLLVKLGVAIALIEVVPRGFDDAGSRYLVLGAAATTGVTPGVHNLLVYALL